MAEKEINAIVKNVTKTTDEWASATEIPAKGAICVETTTDGDTKIKIGDEINPFSGLKYIDCKNADTLNSIPSSNFSQRHKTLTSGNLLDNDRFRLVCFFRPSNWNTY